ncbi:MAG: hypothetical protein QM759_15240 [Terricaulis sp.]
MRSLFFAGLMCAVVAGTALAQMGGSYGGSDPSGGAGGQSGGHSSSGGGSHGGSGGSGHGHDNTPPPPPPIPRCPDLAISTYSYVSAIPGAPALAADEVGIQFEVRNAGTASYIAAAGAQNLTLGYNTPGGPHQVATVALPPAANGQAAARTSELGPQQTWTGYLRATLTPADRRWPLHLKINSGTTPRGLSADCNTNNNDIILARP